MTINHGRVSALSSKPNGPQRPNILFLMTDQQRADTVMPDHPCLTPNLDDLAAQGVRFTRAYTPNAICSPARASLMTGLYPSQHGMVDVTHNVPAYRAELRENVTMWSHRLQESGYRIGYFGKWHVERKQELSAFGMAEYELNHSQGYKSYRQSLGLSERRYAFRKDLAADGYDTRILYGAYDEPAEAAEPYYLYSRGIDFIRSQEGRTEPWAAVISVLEPHDPYVAPNAYVEKYDIDAIELPATLRDDLTGKPGILHRLQSVWRGLSDREVREAIACYYAMCSLIDDQVGRVVQALKESGQWENTIIVYTTDHGDMLGAHGLFMKGVTAYEDVYRIPLIVSGPVVARPGRECAAIVNLVDLAPTLTELTGSAPIEEAAGRSLVPLLRDPEEADAAGASEVWNEGYAEFHGQRLAYTQRLVWHGRYKYIFNGFDLDELYDLQADPLETANLAGNPEYAETLREMAARMWRNVHRLQDESLRQAHYGMFRFLPVGPFAGR